MTLKPIFGLKKHPNSCLHIIEKVHKNYYFSGIIHFRFLVQDQVCVGEIIGLGQWRQTFFGWSAQNEGVGKKPVAAVPLGRPEPEQEVAVSGGIMGMDRKLKGESWGRTGS